MAHRSTAPSNEPQPISICHILQQRVDHGDFRKGEKARFRLMQAAAELLDHTNLHDIRNIDICQRAEIANGMLNTYFGDKFDLVTQLLSLFAEEFQKEFANHKSQTDREEDGYLRIYTKIDYIVATVESNLGVYRLLLDPPQHAPLRQHIAQSFRYWTNDLADDLPDQRFGRPLSKRDKFTMAAMLSGMVDQAIRAVYLSGSQPRGKRHEFVQMLSLLRYSAMFGQDPPVASIKKTASR